MATLHPKIKEVTDRIIEKSRPTRAAYLARIDDARKAGPGRQHLSCGNLAHAFAASPLGDKLTIRGRAPNIGIVTSYNDMLSRARAVRRLPRHHQGRRAQSRRRGAGGGRHAGDVRWRHAGPAGHGAVAVLPRRDRALRPPWPSRMMRSMRR